VRAVVQERDRKGRPDDGCLFFDHLVKSAAAAFLPNPFIRGRILIRAGNIRISGTRRDASLAWALLHT
jgi:hypothetical protein